MYEMTQPPYFFLAASLVAGILCAFTFGVTLKVRVQDWKKNQSTRTLANLKGIQLLLPFSGIACGICGFLASCLQIFTFSPQFSYGFSIPLTALTAGLVWYQLSRVLYQLEVKGAKNIDFDDLGLGTIIPQPQPKQK
ncbi:MAG: hypothetical protein WBA13_11760 [Microcoleaceae cyanobacterium]